MTTTTTKCAGSGKPYTPGTARLSNRTARCGECGRYVGVTATGTVGTHRTEVTA